MSLLHLGIRAPRNRFFGATENTGYQRHVHDHDSFKCQHERRMRSCMGTFVGLRSIRIGRLVIGWEVWQ